MLAEKEVLLEVQVRNNRLYKLINARWSLKGKPNVAAFCRDADAEPVMVGKLLNLKISPLVKEGRHAGQYLVAAEKMAAYFQMSVEELFPLELYRRVVKSKTSVAVSLKQLPYVERAFIEHAMNKNTDVIDQKLIEGKISEEAVHVQ